MVKRHEVSQERITADEAAIMDMSVAVRCRCGASVALYTDGVPEPCPACGRNMWAVITVRAWNEDNPPKGES